MISSTSSSGSRVAAALLAAAALASCRHAPRPPPAPLKLAMFPVENASGGKAPIRSLTEALDAALAARTVQLVPRDALDDVLARHRIRFTGGVDRAAAKALREELGVDAVLVPTLEQYSADAPPKIAVSVRIVGTGDPPVVLWADAVARSGDDAPGLLGLGRITSVADLEGKVVVAVAGSVERWATVGSPGDACGSAGRFQPRRSFRAAVLDDVGRRTVAVLPFANDTPRRGAGDVLVSQFVGQLARSGSFDVLDPGVVREELLAHRIVLESGVSIDSAMVLLDLLHADLVLAGDVQVYEPRAAEQRPPSVEFTSYVLDRTTAELIWSSSSYADGDDGVFFFGAGRVHTVNALSCRMVRGVVERIVGRRTSLEPP